ncbi:nucleotide-sugar transporter-domain-containing protein [Mycotypha africana]|uniref:nucleotide-sugar transporter-domain-containing protein n=1 Tax=Mycotypha africana TaxID=64632 RepID=UPI0022FFF5BE|nr:nucleotide-sugar transporter-domain-containing protein [Mycotypha africana]KAI8970187.1 nucleotide-sugar transporter-domain-containing protein [Mycotypha africana]
MFEAIPIKYLSLLILVVQNSALILMMRYTRANVQQDKLYLASTAVVMSEVIKTVTCLFVLYFSPAAPKRSLRRLCKLLNRELILKWRETAKLAFPAVLYLIQNNLQYVAASNLDAATFQVTYQLKILTTAFFSVVILKKNLTKLKWAALALLTVGIALVVLPESASAAFIAYIVGSSTSTDASAEETRKAVEAVTTGNQSNLEGFIAVLAACLLSGLAGVYFEKILKAPASTPSHKPVPTEDWSSDDEEEVKRAMITEKEDIDDEDEDASNNNGAGSNNNNNNNNSNNNAIWIRNIQMSIFSVLLGLVFVVMLQDGVTIAEKGFFVNYTCLTWVVIFIQALGGLIVALVVKYADNILKGFATSISIILSSVISVWIFNFTFSGAFLLGAALVIYATYLYGL